MVETPQTATQLKPLLIGRASRIVFGTAVLYWGAKLWHENVPAIIASLAVLLLGLSFLVGGLMANPGCEITALLNVLRAKEKRVHCY